MPIVALVAGLCLRLFFVFKFPANSGDTVLYEQMATNWLKHHVYAMEVYGADHAGGSAHAGISGVSGDRLRRLRDRPGPDAHLWVMLAQALVDLLSCVLIATLAATLLLMVNERNPPRRVFTGGAVAGGAVPVYGELYRGAADRGFCRLLHRCGAIAALLAGRAHAE